MSVDGYAMGGDGRSRKGREEPDNFRVGFNAFIPHQELCKLADYVLGMVTHVGGA